MSVEKRYSVLAGRVVERVMSDSPMRGNAALSSVFPAMQKAMSAALECIERDVVTMIQDQAEERLKAEKERYDKLDREFNAERNLREEAQAQAQSEREAREKAEGIAQSESKARESAEKRIEELTQCVSEMEREHSESSDTEKHKHMNSLADRITTAINASGKSVIASLARDRSVVSAKPVKPSSYNVRVTQRDVNGDIQSLKVVPE